MISNSNTAKTPAQVIKEFGNCIELVPTDKHFENISIGLYVKNKVFTLWSFSNKKGAPKRITQIRDQLVSLGGLSPISSSSSQAKFSCNVMHNRPVKFLISQAVNKDPNFSHPEGPMSIKDTKSDLTILVTGKQRENHYVYQVEVVGEAKNPTMRLRMIMAGFVRYGEMEKVGDNEVVFQCRERHDSLMRLLMPYSRNISSVETMMAAESMRGQMTTSTLGFSQT